MKKYIFLFLSLSISISSCIKSGLDEFPVYDEVLITDFNLEYRYVTTNNNGVEQVSIVTLNTTTDINEANGTVSVVANVPQATSSFTESERSKVSLASITAYAKLSPAAKIEPLNGAPKLGAPGDFSEPREYKVTAADGKTTKTWVISIESLNL